ncbi:Calpain-13 [Pteropus alecto]|uniref:Calpain-13 n=1 Tax=Pteropus alecto TaxID=9402 RepID=L5KRL8_PTEAL|nr:Calpain-13 [Pteropus alecto]
MWTLIVKTCEMHVVGLPGVSYLPLMLGSCPLAGDCWFLAALGSLTQNPEDLQKILMDQSFDHQYAGIFRFRFWRCGQWVEVVVDDRLPVINKKYLFVHPLSNNQEFWPCLLEKAYAKFHGSYLHLHYGYLPDALVDLTGGVVTRVDLHSSTSDLVMMVKTAAMAGSLITCATPAGPTGEASSMENGLVSQHAYTVTGAEQIQCKRGWEDLIRLWNPWGNTEWRGRWRDGMSCHDFQENFSCLYICNQFPINLDHKNMPHERWSQMMFKNRVIPGNTAEGLQRDTQYIFSVPESTESNNVIVSFNVMPQNLKAENEKFPLNFHVFKASLPENDSEQRMFYRYAWQGLDIDATQLQSLLNQEFLREAFRNLSKDGKGLYLTKMEVSCLLLPEIGHHPRPPFLT